MNMVVRPLKNEDTESVRTAINRIGLDAFKRRFETVPLSRVRHERKSLDNLEHAYIEALRNLQLQVMDRSTNRLPRDARDVWCRNYLHILLLETEWMADQFSNSCRDVWNYYDFCIATIMVRKNSRKTLLIANPR